MSQFILCKQQYDIYLHTILEKSLFVKIEAVNIVYSSAHCIVDDTLNRI